MKTVSANLEPGTSMNVTLHGNYTKMEGPYKAKLKSYYADTTETKTRDIEGLVSVDFFHFVCRLASTLVCFIYSLTLRCLCLYTENFNCAVILVGYLYIQTSQNLYYVYFVRHAVKCRWAYKIILIVIVAGISCDKHLLYNFNSFTLQQT